MATIESRSFPATATPTVIPGVTPIQWRVISVVTGDAAANPDKLFAASGDVINVARIPRNAVVADCYLSVNASLGAGCTVQLRRGTTIALTGATTAGAASFVRKNTQDTASKNSDDWLNIVVAGANFLASDARIEVMAFLKEDYTYAA